MAGGGVALIGMTLVP
ncbi:MAG: conjugal transfer protein, partial [Lachnospiraceae bacterium]|nr:conjugal transfer protein [Lachnospiraceae bacterium]